MSKQKVATWDDIRALADGGLTANQIASRLNKAELKTPTHKRWYDSTVIYYVRQQLDAAALKKELPQLARDAAKYDEKQAAKKKKKAAATDPNPTVLLKSTRPALPASPDAEANAIIGDAAKKMAQVAGVSPALAADNDAKADGAYAHVVIFDSHAHVDIYPDMTHALKALTTTPFDIAAQVNRILPLADVAALLAKLGVTRVSRSI